MAIVVEHDKRKYEILEKSLQIFAEEGYEAVTFQKIADRCEITRTTLYIYFNNKRDIFLGCIKQLLQGLEKSLNVILQDKSLSAEEALRQTMTTTIDSCKNNISLFSVLLEYLIQLKKSGKDPKKAFRRRLIRHRHILSQLIIRGIKDGSFKPDLNVHTANELLFSIVESSIYRIAALDENELSDTKKTIDFAVDCLLK